jgi:2-phospho-L-lactate guanylyltransferase
VTGNPFIVIPFKDLAFGKSRLADHLDCQARKELCWDFLGRTVTLALTVVDARRIRVVTSASQVADIAGRFSVACICEQGAGLNAALETARAKVLTEQDVEASMAVLPIDLPFADTTAIAEFLSSSGDVVIAPDETGTGTNALLLRQSALRCFRFAFGPGSYAAHLAEAKAHDLAVATMRNWRIAFDVDGQEQYAAWRLGKAARAPAGPGAAS